MQLLYFILEAALMCGLCFAGQVCFSHVGDVFERVSAEAFWFAGVTTGERVRAVLAALAVVAAFVLVGVDVGHRVAALVQVQP